MESKDALNSNVETGHLSKPNQSSSHRIRITIPRDDIAVMKWLEYQHNISYSIRAAIRTHIKKYGYGDPYCGDCQQQGAVGRPVGSTKAKIQETNESVSVSQDVSYAQPVVQTTQSYDNSFGTPIATPSVASKSVNPPIRTSEMTDAASNALDSLMS